MVFSVRPEKVGEVLTRPSRVAGSDKLYLLVNVQG